MTVNAISPLEYKADDQTATFKKVSEILPPQPKALNEARGYIIADYQDHLEKIWIKELRAKYDVEVNDNVFESLIKS